MLAPYKIVNAHPETSHYVLELPESMNIHPSFHASELKPYHANDDTLFPSRRLTRPEAIITAAGDEEYLVDRILDERPRGRGKQYLVRWLGYDAGQDSWVPGAALKDCVALDAWEREMGGSTGR